MVLHCSSPSVSFTIVSW
uniref:Uncharacterized protein n=1 Tax=Anguilla anguilla TaxID=7936 RepID=A0A0E9QH29_ANGAN